jgi:hypothetical protein
LAESERGMVAVRRSSKRGGESRRGQGVLVRALIWQTLIE